MSEQALGLIGWGIILAVVGYVNAQRATCGDCSKKTWRSGMHTHWPSGLRLCAMCFAKHLAEHRHEENPKRGWSRGASG